MKDKTVFDKLVIDLSSKERKKLLDKLQTEKGISSEPLKQESSPEITVDFKQEYKRLNLFQKFIILIKQLLTGKKQENIIEEMLINRLIDKTQSQTQGLIHFSTKRLLNGFYKELAALEKPLAIIREPFGKALEEYRKEFFAFFVSIEIENLQEQLIESLDPNKIFNDSNIPDPAKAKEELHKRFEKILTDIKEEDKSRLYHHAFSLHYFHKLCFFNFIGLMKKFNDETHGAEGSLSFQSAGKELARLVDLLQSAGYPPTATAIEAVFLFNSRKSTQDDDSYLDDAIKKSINQVEAAFNAIRQFNKKIPLEDVIRCINRNLNYKSKKIQGGDDWFVLFKKFWEEKISESYKAFYADMKIKTFLAKSSEYLGMPQFPELKYYNNKIDENLHFKYTKSLAFLKSFHQKIYSAVLIKSLKILLLQGDFYKQENRTEFTDSFNCINSTVTEIENIDKSLAVSEALGNKLEKIQTEVAKGVLNKKVLLQTISEIDTRIFNLIDKSQAALVSLENIINGVLYGSVGGKHDSISNIKRIGGKSNTELLASWKLALNQIHKASEYLKEIVTLETKDAVV